MCAAWLYFSQYAGTNESALSDVPLGMPEHRGNPSVETGRSNLLIKNHISLGHVLAGPDAYEIE